MRDPMRFSAGSRFVPEGGILDFRFWILDSASWAIHVRGNPKSAIQNPKSLRKIPARRAQHMPCFRFHLQRSPLIGDVSLGVEDELVLLPQLGGDVRVDAGELALVLDD